MSTRGLPGNYCDELEQTLRKVHKHVANNISLAQKRQNEDYDKETKVESTQLKPGDRLWLNSKAIPKGKSPKFHQEWTGPYEVLRQLGCVNYHIKPKVGKAKTKVVHQNCLKRLESHSNSELPKINELNEPVITHREEEQLTVPQDTPTTVRGRRRSTAGSVSRLYFKRCGDRGRSLLKEEVE